MIGDEPLFIAATSVLYVSLVAGAWLSVHGFRMSKYGPFLVWT